MHHEHPQVDQLEQRFSMVVREALDELSQGKNDSDAIKLKLLWQQVEPSLTLLSDTDQLRLAGQMIIQLSDLCHAKAERWLTDWQEQYNETGPVMDDDLLAGLVQKTMYLDLSDLIRSKPQPQRAKPQSGSVAGAIDKKKLLNALDTIEAEESAKHKALAVAHDEDVSAWIETIDQWLNQARVGDQFSTNQPCIDQSCLDRPYTVWFSDLCVALRQEDSRMTPVKIFLALLLGGYPLEQPNGFYNSDILIKQRLPA